MRHAAVFVAAILIGLAGGTAAIALGGNPPGQDPCSHGATGKPCRPDPQPEHGKDCEHHGNKGGVNEDHCGPATTDTTPTDTTPTTPTDTTPTETTPTTPTETTATTDHPGQRCPPGMTPTAGKDGQPGNDECEFPKQPTTPTATVPPAVTPPTATPPPTTTTTPSVTPPATKPPATKPKAAVKPKPKVVAKPKPKQPKLTGNPKVDKCKPMKGGTLNCKGTIVVPGSG